MKYYLGPYQEIDEGMGPSLSPPPASIGAINLGGSARNLGLFVLPNSETLGSAFRQIGRAASPDSVSISSISRQQWQTIFGLSETPIATTLTELIRETLMEHADGTGVNHVRPLVAGHDGRLKIWLFDRQIWGGRWNESNQDPRYNAAILRQLKDAYTAKRVANLLEQDEYRRRHYLRWLGYQKRKYNLDRTGWRAIQGDNPEEEPERPETTITESFTGADATFTGADETWTAVYLTAASWEIRSNQLSIWGGHAQTCCDSAVSGDDTYCQLVVKVNGSSAYLIDPIVRADNTNGYGYTWFHYGGASQLRKLTNGTLTNLGTNYFETRAVNDVRKVSADGSTIAGYVNGDEKRTATDTTYGTGAYGGCYGYGDYYSHRVDDWELGDLGGGAVANSHYYLASQAAAI